MVVLVALVVSPGCRRESTSLEPSFRYQLVSNSMSPGLWGPTRLANCQHCGHRWKIAAETADPQLAMADCPNCNKQANLGVVEPGQRIVAEKVGPQYPVRRLDRIIYQLNTTLDQHHSTASDQPGFTQAIENAGTATCKRVWGLPTEIIQLQAGELWINSQLFRKSVTQFLQIAIPVAKLQSTATCPHWRYSSLESQRELDCRSPLCLSAGDQLSWFFRAPYTLHPAETIASQLSQSDLEGLNHVFDDYPEDLNTPRNLTAVNDLCLVARFGRASFPMQSRELQPNPPWSPDVGSCRVQFKCRYQGHEITLVIEDNGTDLVATTTAASQTFQRTVASQSQITIGGWDGRLCIGLGNAEPIYVDIPTVDSNRPTDFEIAMLNGSIELAELTVVRDLYLRFDERSVANGHREPIQLKDDEYFVMGDNLPISSDSRQTGKAVHRRQVIAIAR